MKEDEIYTKASLGCLFTHQPAWDIVGRIIETGQDVMECCKCKIRFCYPSKKADYPIYRK